MAESNKAIVTAAGANLAIALAKFLGAWLTGSAAMVSEGAHSVVDTANQGLLLLGRHRAKRPADALHPYGYGREIYFYSFVVALLIFSAGGLYSIYEGIAKIRHPEAIGAVSVLGVHVAGIWINLAILGFSLAVEGYSLRVALHGMPARAGSPLKAMRRSKDPGLFVVIAEDGAAVAGLLLAVAGVVSSTLLDWPMLDGATSLGIGILLLGVAAFLMIEIHGLLLGEPASPDVHRAIRAVVAKEASVQGVEAILTQHLGPEEILLNMSLDIPRATTGADITAALQRIQQGLKQVEPRIKRVFVETRAVGDD